MGELGALFNPGMRHELEERQAKAARREEEGNAKDGDLRIDLESGVAVINAPGEQGAARPERVAAEAQTAIESAEVGDTGGQAERPADGKTGEGEGGPAPKSDPGVESSAAGQSAGGSGTIKGSAKKSVPPAALRPRGKRGVSAAR